MGTVRNSSATAGDGSLCVPPMWRSLLAGGLNLSPVHTESNTCTCCCCCCRCCYCISLFELSKRWLQRDIQGLENACACFPFACPDWYGTMADTPLSAVSADSATIAAHMTADLLTPLPYSLPCSCCCCCCCCCCFYCFCCYCCCFHGAAASAAANGAAATGSRQQGCSQRVCNVATAPLKRQSYSASSAH